MRFGVNRTTETRTVSPSKTNSNGFLMNSEITLLRLSSFMRFCWVTSRQLRLILESNCGSERMCSHILLSINVVSRNEEERNRIELKSTARRKQRNAHSETLRPLLPSTFERVYRRERTHSEGTSVTVLNCYCCVSPTARQTHSSSSDNSQICSRHRPLR